MEKTEWRKHEKELYLPGRSPVCVDVPPMTFLSLRGKGDPNQEAFGQKVATLHALSFAARMACKWPDPPTDYRPYTVYPLEGVWDFDDPAAGDPPLLLEKDRLVYDLMIRQPSFVTPALLLRLKEQQARKSLAFLDEVVLANCEEGMCVQMMHLGPFDDEPESFAHMMQLCTEQGLVRTDRAHREIYLSDPRRTDPENLRTVLRFRVRRVGEAS